MRIPSIINLSDLCSLLQRALLVDGLAVGGDALMGLLKAHLEQQGSTIRLSSPRWPTKSCLPCRTTITRPRLRSGDRQQNKRRQCRHRKDVGDDGSVCVAPVNALDARGLHLWVGCYTRKYLFDWNPAERCRLPMVVGDLPGGVPAPCRRKEPALMRRQDSITSKQIAEHAIGSNHWTQP